MCSAGWEGQYCNVAVSSTSTSSSQTGVILAATLGTIVPVVVIMLVLAIIGWLYIERSRKPIEEWEISADELEIGEQLGQGGYGAVYKAKWRGTEVAVKMVPSEKVTGEMERNFKEEVRSVSSRAPLLTGTFAEGQVRIMMKLRHPNVVLFMAASTKAESMCLVMEFMALGSLFDVCHHVTPLWPSISTVHCYHIYVTLTWRYACSLSLSLSSFLVERTVRVAAAQ